MRELWQGAEDATCKEVFRVRSHPLIPCRGRLTDVAPRGHMIRPKGKRAKIEHDFAKALAWEIAKAGGLSYRAAVTRLRRLERTYLPMLPGKSSDALELRRRIAKSGDSSEVSQGRVWCAGLERESLANSGCRQTSSSVTKSRCLERI